MLIRHYKPLKHWRRIHREQDAYGGLGDLIVYVAVIVLTTLAALHGWL